MKLLRPSRIVLALLCLMYFLTYIDRVNVSTAAAGFAKEFHFSNAQIGMVFSAFGFTYLLFQVIGGWVSDRFGVRRTLTACGIVWAIATILTGFATGFWSLVFARVLLGFGEGATFPAATAAMARWVSKEKRGLAQGITHSAARIGNAVAPSAIVLLMVAYGWRASFYVVGAVSLLWVVLWSATFTEHPKDHPRITAEELRELPAPVPRAGGLPWGRLFMRMLPVTIVYFCYGWTLWLFLSWIPQYFLHSFDLDLKKSAVFASSVFFAGVIGDTLGGVVTDRIMVRDRQRQESPQLYGFRLYGADPAGLAADAVFARSDGFGGVPVRRILFLGDDHRSDVGDPDGHRQQIRRHGKWHDEYRVGARGDRFAGHWRLADRCDRQLGSCRSPAAWR